MVETFQTVTNAAYEVVRHICGTWKENCYVVLSRSTHDGVIIDPGSEVEEIWSTVCHRRVRIRAILLTHAHYDHVDGLWTIRQRTEAPIFIHKSDAMLLKSANAYAVAWKLPVIKIPSVDTLLAGDETLGFGALAVNVMHLPGHSLGSVGYAIGNMLFVGDTLLTQTVGRVDLPGGDEQALGRSIHKIVSWMTPQSIVYPGHGDPFDLRFMLKNNEEIRHYL
jgi:hydroxyacylglutathione hydrolase